MESILELYNPTDFIVTGSTQLKNKFFANVDGRFIGPTGQIKSVPGFYNGNDEWIVRFSPEMIGEWSYTIESSHIEPINGNINGNFSCVKNTSIYSHGPVQIKKDDAYKFCYKDQTDYFMNAYEANWIWAMDIPQMEEFVNLIQKYGFNMVVTNVYAYDTSWRTGKTSEYDYGPPDLFAWGGTNENPDHSEINTLYFQKYDKFMQLMLSKNMNVHLYFKVYNKRVNWMERYSENEELYIKYVTARYQAYPNVVWDFSKESFLETDKEYLAWFIKKIRSYDSYKRLLTTHDDCVFFDKPEYCALVDYITLQHHEHYSARCEFYYYALYHKARYQKPLFFAEFGYESGPQGIEDITYPVGHSAEELIDIAIEVVMSQSYPTYYYTKTAWDVIDYSYTPKGYTYFKNLYDIVCEYDLMSWEVRMPMCSHGCKMLVRNNREYMFSIERNRSYNINVYDIVKDYVGSNIKVEWIGIQERKTVTASFMDMKPLLTDAIRGAKAPFDNEPAFLHVLVEVTNANNSNS